MKKYLWVLEHTKRSRAHCNDNFLRSMATETSVINLLCESKQARWRYVVTLSVFPLPSQSYLSDAFYINQRREKKLGIDFLSCEWYLGDSRPPVVLSRCTCRYVHFFTPLPDLSLSTFVEHKHHETLSSTTDLIAYYLPLRTPQETWRTGTQQRCFHPMVLKRRRRKKTPWQR